MKTNISSRIDISPYRKSTVSAKGLLHLIEKTPNKIEDVQFVPPKLGTKSLGKFIVQYAW